MAQIKRGSKGKDVEALQTRLNKLGAKPQLKVDGDFGPITQKAVIAFQKSAKLKPTDGVIGKYTEAALKMGGPLPVMEVPDLSPGVKIAKEFQKHNLLMNGFMMALDGATSNVGDILDKEIPRATKMIDDNMPLWADVIKLATEIAAKQKNFDAILLSDPKKASVLSKACDAQYEAAGNIMDKVEKNVDSLYDTLDTTLKDLGKGVGLIEEMMAKLKKHARKSEKFF